MKSDIDPSEWRQVGGDVSAAEHGATIARFDSLGGVEIREIQSVVALVGEKEAKEEGHPYWTKEAYYSASDLEPGADGVSEARKHSGLEELPEDLAHRKLAIAECLLSYGHGSEEGQAGWGKDVLPEEPVHWWSEEEPKGQDYFEPEDAEFRFNVLGDGWECGWGQPGYLYDGRTGLCETKEDAIASALETFSEAGPRTRARITADLREHGIHYLDRRLRRLLGASYLELFKQNRESPEE